MGSSGSRLVGGGVSSARQRTLSRGSSVESDTNSSTTAIAGKCVYCMLLLYKGKSTVCYIVGKFTLLSNSTPLFCDL